MQEQERDEDGRFTSESNSDDEQGKDEQGKDKSKVHQGANARDNPGNFANDPDRAREAGRKGGKS